MGKRRLRAVAAAGCLLLAAPARAQQAYTSPKGTFSMEWQITGTDITFTARAATTDGYLSLGFSGAGTGFHSGGDCITVFDNAGQPVSQDASSNGFVQPTIDAQNNYEVVSASVQNAQYTIVVTRPLALVAPEDQPIVNDNMNVHWAFGPVLDPVAGTYGSHGTNYETFTINLQSNTAQAIGTGGSFQLDPAFGLVLTTAGPVAAFAIIKLILEIQKGGIRDYTVVERAQTPVARLATGMANRVSIALGFSQQGGYGQGQPAQAYSNGLPQYGQQQQQQYPAPRSAFGRMSMTLTQMRSRIVKASYAPKKVDEQGLFYDLKIMGRKRIVKEMTVFQAFLMVLFLATAIFWVYGSGLNRPADAWGYLCCSGALLTVIPATRNSVLTWFLFQPFEKTLFYHRWLGRFTFWAGAIHTGYYFVAWGQAGTLGQNLGIKKYRDGLFSMIGLTLLFITSFDQVRRKYYSAFRIMHYFFFLFYIFGVIHTPVFFVYAVLSGALYGTDILMRYGLDLLPKNAFAVDVLPGEVTRVRFPKSRWKSYAAGQYVFLNFPAISRGEWHPYTLSSGPHQDYLEVHIKALGDHTRQILAEGARVMASGGRAALPRVRVDGPYGRIAFNYKRYENVFLVGGGVGVTPMISVLKDLFHIEVSPNQQRKHPISPFVRNVYFLWVVKNSSPWVWFFQTLQKAMETSVRGASLGFPKLRIKGYVTKPDPNLQSLQDAISNIPMYSVSQGRPDVGRIMEGVEASIGAGKKRIAVLACGPTPLVNSIWDNCRLRTGKGITYDCHREEFDF